MPTLGTVFKIFDGYTSTIDKIVNKTDQATSKIIDASGATDKLDASLNSIGVSASSASGSIDKIGSKNPFIDVINGSNLADKKIDDFNKKIGLTPSNAQKANNELKKTNNILGDTNNKATQASKGLGRLIGTFLSLAAAKKGMEITDEYINTASRLALINDGLQTQAELQEKIFAAADRSKGAYASMAGAVSKLGLLAGDAFSSNDELITFTEIVQKSFKVGGSGTAEQQSAMLQLSQAMGSGRLQGDEFTSITENAPMIADAIAKYTGKSKGELKKMSSEGAITSDIIKNAMFTASDQINEKFKTMPMTFGDVWNKIKNGATKAFGSVMENLNSKINSEGFINFLNGVIVGFTVLANIAGWALDGIANNLHIIVPILAIIGTVLLINMIASLWAAVPPLIAQAIAWLAIYWPILLVIAVIGLVVAAVRYFGATWEDILGFVGGGIGMFATFVNNMFVYIWNGVAAFINFFGNVFNNPIASIKVLFYDLMVNVLGFIEKMAGGIEFLLNKIPGVKVDITSGIENLKNKLAKESATIKSEAGLVEYVKTKDFMDYSDGWAKGSDIGKSLPGKLEGLTNSLTGLGDFGSSSTPITIKGTGKNDNVDVSMASEDLQYLRDIAERDYINKFSSATLAPNIQISFGDVHETADADKVAKRIRTILQDEIAVAAEGVYDV